MTPAGIDFIIPPCLEIFCAERFGHCADSLESMSTPFPAPERTGTIPVVFLPGLLCKLHRLSFSGTVQMRRDSLLKSVYFLQGEILSAASNEETDRLSSLLLRGGLVTPEQMEMAREKARPGISLGRSLVELGFVSRSRLMETAREQVQGILSGLFDWDSGEYELLEGQVPAAVPNLRMKTEKLLFDSLQLSTNRAAVLREIGGMDRCFTPARANNRSWKGWSLGEETRTVLSSVNGTANVTQLAAKNGLDDFTAAKILCAGVHFGILEPVEIPPPDSAQPEEEAAPPEEVPVTVSVGPEEFSPDAAFEGNPAVEPAEPAGNMNPVSRPFGTMRIPSKSIEPSDPPGEGPAADSSPDAIMEPVQAEASPSPEEGPFQGYVDTSAETRIRYPKRMEGGKNFFRSRWMAFGGILIGGALVLFAMALFTADGSSETEVVLPAPKDAQEHPPIPETEDKNILLEEIPATGMTGLESRILPEPAAPPPSPVDISPLEKANRSLLAKDFPGAADQYRDILSRSPGGAYTLQILLACQASTVAKMIPPPEESYLLPIRFKGKPCYRICWGSFPSRNAALRAGKQLPATYAKMTNNPFPLSIAKAVSGPDRAR